MKKVIVTVLTLILCQAGIAQSEKMNDRIEKRVQDLDELLDLNEEQEKAIQGILLDAATQAKAIRSEHEGSREEIKALRNQSSKQIKALLNEEQLATLEQHKMHKKEQRKIKRQTIKEHKNSEVKPALKAERAKFEMQLSQEEKDVLKNAREMARALHVQDRKSLSREDRRAKRTEIMELIQPIVETHQEELTEIKTRLQPALDEHRVLKQEARVRKTKADIAPPAKDRKGKFEMKFLLMEP